MDVERTPRPVRSRRGVRRRRDRVAAELRHYIWTRKQADVPARGFAEIDGKRHEIDGVAFIDESAGYHDRHTAWKWSAGNGLTSDGRAVPEPVVAECTTRPRTASARVATASRPRSARSTSRPFTTRSPPRAVARVHEWARASEIAGSDALALPAAVRDDHAEGDPAMRPRTVWAMASFSDTKFDLEPQRVKELVEGGEAQLVDVREPYEWEAGPHRRRGPHRARAARRPRGGDRQGHAGRSSSAGWDAAPPSRWRRSATRATTRTTWPAASRPGPRRGYRSSPRTAGRRALAAAGAVGCPHAGCRCTERRVTWTSAVGGPVVRRRPPTRVALDGAARRPGRAIGSTSGRGPPTRTAAGSPRTPPSNITFARPLKRM